MCLGRRCAGPPCGLPKWRQDFSSQPPHKVGEVYSESAVGRHCAGPPRSPTRAGTVSQFAAPKDGDIYFVRAVGRPCAGPNISPRKQPRPRDGDA
eukprot:3506924-Pyramimonas_sp.AAC.1